MWAGISAEHYDTMSAGETESLLALDERRMSIMNAVHDISCEGLKEGEKCIVLTVKYGIVSVIIRQN